MDGRTEKIENRGAAENRYRWGLTRSLTRWGTFLETPPPRLAPRAAAAAPMAMHSYCSLTCSDQSCEWGCGQLPAWGGNRETYSRTYEGLQARIQATNCDVSNVDA